MTAEEILKILKPLGTESYRRVLRNHGVREPLFGVKIEELKKIQKRVKKDYQLALDLYDSGIYDAQYLAGLIADDAKMTKKNLSDWLVKANCFSVCGFTLAWVAAESPHGREMALQWIDSKQEMAAQAGWATLSSFVSITDNSRLNMGELKKLLQRVERTINQQPDNVRRAMNGFLIATGIYVTELTEVAVKTAHKIGPISIDVGDTECKVPFAPDQIEKAKKRGAIGKKRKTAKC